MNNAVNNLSLVLEALSLQILFQDFNNVDLMKEIQKIINQNEEIIQLLKERGENNGNRND